MRDEESATNSDGSGRGLPPIVILYGSATGNASDVAETLAVEARRLLFEVELSAMDDFDTRRFGVTKQQQEMLMIFVASTTGQGEAPDNMQRFWRSLLRRSLPPDCLAHVRFGVFGLGDSAYRDYNVVAKRLFRRLESLGGQALCPLGLGNDQDAAGYDDKLAPWCDELWAALLALHPVPAHLATRVYPKDALPPVRYRVTIVPAPGLDREGATDAVVAPGAGGAFRGGTSAAGSVGGVGRNVIPERQKRCRIMRARVLANRRITAKDHWQDVRQIEFALGGENWLLEGDERLSDGDNIVEGAGERVGGTKEDTTGAADASVTLTDNTDGYRPGDVLAIKPVLPHEEVAEWLRRQLDIDEADGDTTTVVAERGMTGQDDTNEPGSVGGRTLGGICAERVTEIVDPMNTWVVMTPNALDAPPWPHGPQPRRLIDLFTCDLEAGGVPRRAFFAQLAHFAKNADHAERLQQLASAEGAAELSAYCFRERRTYIEVLNDFASARPPLERLVDMVRPLRPRMFSIASAPRRVRLNAAHERECLTAQIAVALVRFTTPYGRRREGLCSRFLATCSPGDSVNVWVERGTLHFPPVDAATPITMVGPGTGLAPFRSYLQHVASARMRRVEGQDGGGVRTKNGVLYFGCRNRDKDYLFGTELAAFAAEENGPLRKLHVAFSRDQPERGKVYVQHLMAREEDRQWLWQTLGPGGDGMLMIAGNAKDMPDDVLAAVASAFEACGNLPNNVATLAVKRLQLAGRIQMETWTT